MAMKVEPGLGLLLAMMDPGDGDEERFNAWYDGEHMPERLAVPGFRSAQRWVTRKSPRYLALYDLASVHVLESPAYRGLSQEPSALTSAVLGQAMNRRRGVYEQIQPGTAIAPEGAAALMLVELDCDPSVAAEFEEWYSAEHLPLCAGVPGVLSGRRFRALEGSPQYLTIYHLSSAEVARDPGWAAALATPWSQRMQPHLRNLAIRLYQAYGG